MTISLYEWCCILLSQLRNDGLGALRTFSSDEWLQSAVCRCRNNGSVTRDCDEQNQWNDEHHYGRRRRRRRHVSLRVIEVLTRKHYWSEGVVLQQQKAAGKVAAAAVAAAAAGWWSSYHRASHRVSGGGPAQVCFFLSLFIFFSFTSPHLTLPRHQWERLYSCNRHLHCTNGAIEK